jgi:hypothetical protein
MSRSPTTETIEAQLLIDKLRDRGVPLEGTAGGKLRFSPKSALSERDVERLKQHKETLLSLISVPSVPTTPNADTCGDSPRDTSQDTSGHEDTPSVPSELPEILQRDLKRASEVGLVARFSREFGYIELHDPTSGEWYEVPFTEAPQWAPNEAFKRKDLRKIGKAHDLPACEMEELWASEQAEMWSEAPPAPGRKAGLIYDEDLSPDPESVQEEDQ